MKSSARISRSRIWMFLKVGLQLLVPPAKERSTDESLWRRDSSQKQCWSRQGPSRSDRLPFKLTNMDSVLALAAATMSTFALTFLVSALVFGYTAASLQLQLSLWSSRNFVFELRLSFVDQWNFSWRWFEEFAPPLASNIETENLGLKIVNFRRQHNRLGVSLQENVC